jgi:protein SCO1
VPPRLKYTIVGVTACGLAVVAGLWAAALGGSRPAGPEGTGAFNGAVRPAGAGVPEFALRDQEGRLVRSGELLERGEPVVFTFVYSTCEDTCPIQVQQIRGALDRLGRDLPVVGVSVDPANDTPRRARSFLLEQHMTGRMTFLLGDEDQLEPVWEAFGIAPQRHGREHSAYVVVVDGAGRQRVGFPASQLTVDGLAGDLRRLGA